MFDVATLLHDVTLIRNVQKLKARSAVARPRIASSHTQNQARCAVVDDCHLGGWQ
jgi:hypothetical protein